MPKEDFKNGQYNFETWDVSPEEKKKREEILDNIVRGAARLLAEKEILGAPKKDTKQPINQRENLETHFSAIRRRQKIEKNAEIASRANKIRNGLKNFTLSMDRQDINFLNTIFQQSDSAEALVLAYEQEKANLKDQVV